MKRQDRIIQMKIHDINIKLSSIDKRTTQLCDSLEYISGKINEIYNETFYHTPTLGMRSISPISSPKYSFRNYRQLSSGSEESVDFNDNLPQRNLYRNAEGTVEPARAPTYVASRKKDNVHKSYLPHISNKQNDSKSRRRKTFE